MVNYLSINLFGTGYKLFYTNGAVSTLVAKAERVTLEERLHGIYEELRAMAYAIVSTSGTQLRVEPGRFYDVNRIGAEADDAIALDQVLFVENDGDVMIGQPLVKGAVVEATVMQHLRGRKIIVYKMQPKKKTRKKRGHRQELTRIMINAIKVDGKVIAEDSESSEPATPMVDAEPTVETEASGAAETEATETET